MAASQDMEDLVSKLTHVLGELASIPDPVDGVSHLLAALSEMLDVQSSALVLFEDPGVVYVNKVAAEILSAFEAQSALAMRLDRGFHVDPELPDGLNSPTDHWLVGVVRSARQPVALLWIFTQSEDVQTIKTDPLLESVLSIATMLTRNIRTIRHQRKLSRNQSEFMRIVAHDLRSPLTAMHGFASMLESIGPLTEQQSYFVEKILSGISQISTLVDNFHDAGRFDPETGFYEMDRKPCDVTDLVGRVVASYLLPAEKQDLTVSTYIADNVPIVNADHNMLERAVINLVDNAIKYTPNGSRVDIGVFVRSDEIIIEVKDNGLGISPENQSMLFERHVRIARREYKKVKGSGLGLFIVRSVAQRHGGRAWVQSEEGVGTSFFISVPISDENSIIPPSRED